MDPIRPAEKGGEAGQDGPRIREHPAHHGNRVVGQQGVACSTQTTGAVASCTPRLIAAARPRVSCRTTSSPAASAMATEASVLPPSTASTSAGGGSREALSPYGRPEIFNTDQDSQFTSDDFTGTLKRHGPASRPLDRRPLGDPKALSLGRGRRNR